MDIFKKVKHFFFVVDTTKNDTFIFFLLTKKKIPVGISTGMIRFFLKIFAGVSEFVHRGGDKCGVLCFYSDKTLKINSQVFLFQNVRG